MQHTITSDVIIGNEVVTSIIHSNKYSYNVYLRIWFNFFIHLQAIQRSVWLMRTVH